MRIIKQSERGVSVSYHRLFNEAQYGAARFRGGYGFECDASGNVDVSKLQPPARDAWQQLMRDCTVDGRKYIDLGIDRREQSYYLAAVGECIRCNRPVELSHFTNTCECGADYNMSGQVLAPRSQWGEETGETADDILRGDFSLDE